MQRLVRGEIRSQIFPWRAAIVNLEDILVVQMQRFGTSKAGQYQLPGQLRPRQGTSLSECEGFASCITNPSLSLDSLLRMHTLPSLKVN